MKIKIIDGIDITAGERYVPDGYIIKVPEASYLEPMNQFIDKNNAIIVED